MCGTRIQPLLDSLDFFVKLFHEGGEFLKVFVCIFVDFDGLLVDAILDLTGGGLYLTELSKAFLDLVVFHELFELLNCCNGEKLVHVLVVSEIGNLKRFADKVFKHFSFLFQMILGENLFHFLFGEGWDNDSRMIIH
jgi:hypothetical protein